MKKLLFLVFLLVGVSQVSFAQKRSKKLSADQSAKMTPEQRLVHETNRKTKGGKKKDLSLKQKIRAEERQDRKARKIKGKGRR